MAKFFINFENCEDTFDSAETLMEAIEIAKAAAKQGQAGDPVCIEHNGKNIYTFVLLPNGSIAEKKAA